MGELQAWQEYAMHLVHCGLCGHSAVHCAYGQQLRTTCFDTDFPAPTRDPALRKAALGLLCAAEAYLSDCDSEEARLLKAMDALREELAR